MSDVLVRFGAKDEYLAFGRAGWAWVNLPKEVDKQAWVQVADSPEGRLIVRGIWIETPAGVTGRGLDQLPLGRIESAINSPAVAEQVRTLLAAEDWTAATPWSGIPPLGELAPPRIGLTLPLPRLALKLRDPGGRKRPDEFYQRVAEIYSAQSIRSSQPAADLADANGVPATTVARWLKEARRRGLLAPVRRTKTGDGK